MDIAYWNSGSLPCHWYHETYRIDTASVWSWQWTCAMYCKRSLDQTTGVPNLSQPAMQSAWSFIISKCPPSSRSQLLFIVDNRINWSFLYYHILIIHETYLKLVQNYNISAVNCSCISICSGLLWSSRSDFVPVTTRPHHVLDSPKELLSLWIQ